MALTIHSPEYQRFRADCKRQWQAVNAPCALCGQATIEWDAPANDRNAFELDHKISRKRMKAMNRPDLLIDPNNCRPAHCRCNRSKQDGDGPASMGETTEEW